MNMEKNKFNVFVCMVNCAGSINKIYDIILQYNFHIDKNEVSKYSQLKKRSVNNKNK